MDQHYTHNHTVAPHHHLVRYFRDNLSIALGLVLIWRGMWYVLDAADQYVFLGNHLFTALPWLLLGVLILYLPDKDLKELQKL